MRSEVSSGPCRAWERQSSQFDLGRGLSQEWRDIVLDEEVPHLFCQTRGHVRLERFRLGSEVWEGFILNVEWKTISCCSTGFGSGPPPKKRCRSLFPFPPTGLCEVIERQSAHNDVSNEAMGFGSKAMSASQHGIRERKKNPPRLGSMDKRSPEVPVSLPHVSNKRAKH
eukprot:scaffold863_cov100-Cylindrotheca_fusiformis.AAC.3